MALRVFVDFDGTITRQDVGNALFRTFGGPACDRLVEQYRGELLSARACFRGEAAAMGRFPMEALHAFIDAQEIDGTFRGLVDLCAATAIDLRIISDGLDHYVARILAAHGFPNVPFFANALTLVDLHDDGTARAAIAFPYADAECDRCACCKRNIMLTLAGDDDILCLIGDGYSDRCPARYADIVFAKDGLQTWCQQENISYYPYASFDDVTARLRTLLARPRLRPRRRAAENRRAAFARES